MFYKSGIFFIKAVLLLLMTLEKRTLSRRGKIKAFPFLVFEDDMFYIEMSTPVPSHKSASAKCSEAGSHLATIKSAKTNRFLKTAIGPLKHLPDGIYSFYIGLERKEDSDFAWINSVSHLSKKDFSDWFLGAPEINASKLCAALGGSNGSFLDYQWRAVECSQRLFYICEKGRDARVIDDSAKPSSGNRVFVSLLVGGLLLLVLIGCGFWKLKKKRKKKRKKKKKKNEAAELIVNSPDFPKIHPDNLLKPPPKSSRKKRKKRRAKQEEEEEEEEEENENEDENQEEETADVDVEDNNEEEDED